MTRFVFTIVKFHKNTIISGEKMQSLYVADPVVGILISLLVTVLFDGGILLYLWKKYKFGLGFKIGFFILLAGLIPNSGSSLMLYLNTVGARDLLELIFGVLDIIVVIISLVYIVKKMINPISSLVDASESIAQGRLSTNLPDIKSNDEISRLREAFGDMNDFLKDIVSDLQDSSIVMTASSRDLASSSEEVNASSEEISAITQKISFGAQKQNDSLAELVSLSNSLKMTLDNKIAEINVANTLIENISSQVNMLSLNASIEAARAGEYGRGFSVVAENIRKLADESKNSVNKVNDTIDSLRLETQNSLSNLINSVDSLLILANDTAAGSEEASAATEEQSATMEEITASAQELSNLSTKLETLLARFTL